MLSEQEEMYGYEISQKVKSRSGDSFEITEGALYPALHRLESKGWLVSETRSIGNRNRKYYSLSEEGTKALDKSLLDMEAFISGLQLIMQPKLT